MREIEPEFSVVEETFDAPELLSSQFPGASLYENDIPCRNLVQSVLARPLTKIYFNTGGSAENLGEKPLDVPFVQESSKLDHYLRKFLDTPLKISVINGGSRSGKTILLNSICRKLGLQAGDTDIFEWNYAKSVLSHFEEGVFGKPIFFWLLSTGLNSIKSWCKSYRILSTGEKYRAHLARKLFAFCKNPSTQPLMIDDFALYLDQKTATNCAICFSKVVKSFPLDLRVIICTNDDHLVESLKPDIVLNVDYITHLHEVKFSVSVEQETIRMPDSEIVVSNELILKTFEELYSKEKENVGETEQKPKDACQQLTNYSVVRTKVECDDKTKICNALFDHRFTGEHITLLKHEELRKHSLSNNWRVGVITGSSGSLKSVYMKHYFGDAYNVEWNHSLSFKAHFEPHPNMLTILEEIFSIFDIDKIQLNHLLIRQVDSFNSISKSEIEIMTLTRILYHIILNSSGETNDPDSLGFLCIDEFMSTFDDKWAEQTAQRFIHFILPKIHLRIVLVTCKENVVNTIYKQADWVVDMCAASKTKFYGLDSSPPGTLLLQKCNLDLWNLFKEHHYKTEKISKRAHCFVVVNGEEIVAFVAAIPQVGKFNSLSGFRAHRTVVLPNWQGVRIGRNLSDAAAELFTLVSLLKHYQDLDQSLKFQIKLEEMRRIGVRETLAEVIDSEGVYFGQTIHPRFGTYRDRSIKWKATKHNHTWQKYKIETWKQRKKNIRVELASPRFLYSHVYIGE